MWLQYTVPFQALHLTPPGASNRNVVQNLIQWLFKNSSTFIFHIFVGSTFLCVSLELQFTWRRILGLFLWCLLTVWKDVHAVWACSFSICEVEIIGIQMLGHRVKWQRFCMQVEICLHIWKHLIWSLIHCRSSPSRLPSSGPVFAQEFSYPTINWIGYQHSFNSNPS